MDLLLHSTRRPEHPAETRPVSLRALAQVHSRAAPEGRAPEAPEGAAASEPVHADARQADRRAAVQAAGEVPARVAAGQASAPQEDCRGEGQGQGRAAEEAPEHAEGRHQHGDEADRAEESAAGDHRSRC